MRSMTLRWGVVAAAMALLMVVAAPAAVATGLDVSLATDAAAPSATPDSPIVVAGEPTRACAAPAFAQPIDHVDAQPLAATGVAPALQVVALAAFALAGLMAPRRRRTSELPGFSPRGHEDPQD